MCVQHRQHISIATYAGALEVVGKSRLERKVKCYGQRERTQNLVPNDAERISTAKDRHSSPPCRALYPPHPQRSKSTAGSAGLTLPIPFENKLVVPVIPRVTTGWLGNWPPASTLAMEPRLRQKQKAKQQWQQRGKGDAQTIHLPSPDCSRTSQVPTVHPAASSPCSSGSSGSDHRATPDR